MLSLPSGSKNADDYVEPIQSLVDSDEETISDVAAESQCSYHQRENRVQTCPWSAILEEADGLAQKKNYNSSNMSEISQMRKIHRGGRGRARLKFSIRPQSQKEELPWPCAIKNSYTFPFEDDSDGLEHIAAENSMMDLLGNLQEEIDESPTKLVLDKQRDTVPSVTDLLEDLQEKNVLSNEGSSNLLLQNAKAKDRAQSSRKRATMSLGTRVLDNEDPPEFVGDEMSSEDEVVDQNILGFAAENVKGQTMTDLFQEAVSKSTVEEPLLCARKHARTGYLGRLQQVVLEEKDRHLEFLKKLQTRSSPCNESRCIDVRILSRILEAKLTVCHCLFGESAKNFKIGESSEDFTDDGGTIKGTIVFSSKTCDNVELEVGNLIRIHPPWKEIQVNGDENIILCMYFSQITGG